MSISINKKYSFEISINSPTILVRNHSQLNQLDYESSGHTGFASEQDILDLESDKVDKNNVITAGTKTKITYDEKGLVTGGADLVPSDIGAVEEALNDGKTYARKNKSWVELQSGFLPDEELTPSDIPNLDAGKITTGTFGVDRIPALAPSKITQDASNRFVTDTEKSTWNGKQDALTAGDGISISGNSVISATGVDLTNYYNKTQTETLINDAILGSLGGES